VWAASAPRTIGTEVAGAGQGRTTLKRKVAEGEENDIEKQRKQNFFYSSQHTASSQTKQRNLHPEPPLQLASTLYIKMAFHNKHATPRKKMISVATADH